MEPQNPLASTPARLQPPMTHWSPKHLDVLDQPADVLICSANVFLNLSGGALLLRYGPRMQQELHQYLTARNLRHAEQGDVIATSPCGSPYRAVLHAVAVDGFYQSSPETVRSVAAKALRLAAALGAHTVALPALATGFGPLTIQQFALGILPLTRSDFPPIQSVVICLRHSLDADDLRRIFAAERHLSAGE